MIFDVGLFALLCACFIYGMAILTFKNLKKGAKNEN